MTKTVVALFDTYSSAENAARQIKDRGLRTEDISIVAKQEREGSFEGATNNNTFTSTTDVDNASMKSSTRATNDNISNGVLTGGVLGGLAGLLIGAGSMVVPGLGIIAAAGPITGLISGAVTGGIVGGLVDLGIPEDKSKNYESDLKKGKILFSMKSDVDKVTQITSILKSNGAISVDSY